MKNKSMAGNKSKGTKPELLVRLLLREAGYGGYRLNWKKAPGKPDICYPGRKIAIFVNGCFWHRCPNCNPDIPKTNTGFWRAKFDRNVERDGQNMAELKNDGWRVMVVWECELSNSLTKIVKFMENAVHGVKPRIMEHDTSIGNVNQKSLKAKVDENR